jgi:predicted nucleic acid-binding protein
VLLAAADRSDPDHTSSRELLETHPGPLVTTTLVMAESGWLIDRQLGPAAEAALYESAAAGEIRVEPSIGSRLDSNRRSHHSVRRSAPRRRR